MTHLKGQKLIASTQVRGYNRISYYIHGSWVEKINFCCFRCVINDWPYTLL